ncbi:putative protein phosphatase 2C-like protein 44 [Magnolia sinica]|uniref:putative protein phosphatase 2C-like protein 44 n=1 Tax=Magnolia sinica TaxID=86752 RepID=UPI002657FD73|nr:putative protein phosphatase 2C-like protein 44 [Magnolia sinica]
MMTSSRMNISHGSYVVEDTSRFGEITVQDTLVFVQKVSGLCLFGVFDGHMGDAVPKYIQSHLFDKELNEIQFWKEAKETMKRAFKCIKTSVHHNGKMGSAAMVVMNGKRFVAANVGDYKAILSVDGMAIQIGQKSPPTCNRPFSLNSITEFLHASGNCIIARTFGKQREELEKNSSEPLVSDKKIDSHTEFIILASTGVWEVMRKQEAVNLIRHIEDAKEAAEWIAKEAVSRMSRGSISCLVIRFHKISAINLGTLSS